MLGSPLHAIAGYERDAGIPAGFINRVIADAGRDGAWARLETGRLEREAFLAEFERECAAAGQRVDALRMLTLMGEATVPRPQMLGAIRRIRRRGLTAAALTNNWAGEGDPTRPLEAHFDHFVESCVVGLQKPDPRIYHHCCELIGITPPEAVFLDDIGRNLKSARQLGMTTIKVDDPDAALDALEAVLGFALREDT